LFDTGVASAVAAKSAATHGRENFILNWEMESGRKKDKYRMRAGVLRAC
jgi:hypothetical protein